MPLVEPLTRNQAAVRAPGLGGVVFGEADEMGGLARVLHAAGHGDVDAQARLAEQLPQPARGAFAVLVPGGVEGRVPRAR